MIFAFTRDKDMLIEKALGDDNCSDWTMVVNKNLQDWEVDEYRNLLQLWLLSNSAIKMIS